VIELVEIPVIELVEITQRSTRVRPRKPHSTAVDSFRALLESAEVASAH